MAEGKRIFVVLAIGFVLLGVNLTIQGVTWPSVAETFDRPLSNLGFVTLLYGSGYTVSTLISGRLAESPGVRAVLLMGTAGATMGLAAYGAAPTFPVYLGAAGLMGLAGGLMDAATNTYVAVEHGAREMGLLHGAVGVGAIAGPILITALLGAGIDWRFAFTSLALMQVAYTVPLWRVTRTLDISTPEAERPGASSLHTPTLFWSMAVFFVHNGMATTAGAWAFTYLTEERGFGDGVGGVVVAGFYAGFTLSRFILGAVGERFHPNAVLRWSAAASLGAFAVVAADPAGWIVVVALVTAGFAIGPIFPLEMLLTPRRVGRAATAKLVGYEMAAGNVGAAAIPGLAGVAVAGAGLGVIPPMLVGLAVLMIVTVERLRMLSTGDLEAAR